MTMASIPSVRAAWIRSTSAPSWLVWKKERVAPKASACVVARDSTSESVSEP